MKIGKKKLLLKYLIIIKNAIMNIFQIHPKIFQIQNIFLLLIDLNVLYYLNYQKDLNITILLNQIIEIQLVLKDIHLEMIVLTTEVYHYKEYVIEN